MKLDPTVVSGCDSSAFQEDCCPRISCVALCGFVCVWRALWSLQILCSLSKQSCWSAWLEKTPEAFVHLISSGHCRQTAQAMRSLCTNRSILFFTSTSHSEMDRILRWCKAIAGSADLPLVSSEKHLGMKPAPEGFPFFSLSSPITP